MSTTNAPQAIGPYAQAVKVGSLVFTSGQIAISPESGNLVGETTGAQTEQVMKNLSAVLAASNSSFCRVVKTTCYLADMADFAEFNAVYGQYITSAARSCVAVKALPKGALVEVDLIAEVD
ncbi:MAG: Rid family detoxifying hydrolase [Clostridia bacterium]|nr:Rid family detoxifying hydrolase [Clostridia bacterium]